MGSTCETFPADSKNTIFTAVRRIFAEISVHLFWVVTSPPALLPDISAGRCIVNGTVTIFQKKYLCGQFFESFRQPKRSIFSQCPWFCAKPEIPAKIHLVESGQATMNPRPSNIESNTFRRTKCKRNDHNNGVEKLFSHAP